MDPTYYKNNTSKFSPKGTPPHRNSYKHTPTLQTSLRKL